jgi:hypothetical protein
MSEEINDNSNEMWIKPDGTFGDLTKAPEGIGEFVSKKGWKDTPAMIQSYQALESKLSSMPSMDGMVRIPADDDAQGWQTFSHEHLGVPEKAEDYNYVAKDGAPMDDNLLSLFKQSAFKDGMPQKAFQDVVDFQVGAIVESNKQYEDKAISDREESQKAIRERFNTEDEYNAYTKQALEFADKFKLKDGTTTAADVLERTGLAYDPEILEVFNTLANRTQEDSLPFGETRVIPNKDAQLKAITSNPAFTQAVHPDHPAVMEAYWALLGLKNVKQNG